MGRKFLGSLLALVLTSSTATLGSQSGKPVTNEDVVRMVRAGFADSTILKYLQAGDVDFDLSVSAVVRLKYDGVSPSLIEAMLAIAVAKNAGNAVPELTAIISRSPSSPEGVVVFAHQKGQLVEVEPETVAWRNTGLGKSMASLGGHREAVNGTVSGLHSQLVASWPPLNIVPIDMEFYIFCADGSSASDFQLLRLLRGKWRPPRDFPCSRRECARPTDVGASPRFPFTFEEVAPGTGKVALPNLSVGEYGFLAPVSEVNLQPRLPKARFTRFGSLNSPPCGSTSGMPRRVSRPFFFRTGAGCRSGDELDQSFGRLRVCVEFQGRCRRWRKAHSSANACRQRTASSRPLR